MSKLEINTFILGLTSSQKDDLLKYSFADIAYNCDIETASQVETYLKEDGKDNYDKLPESKTEDEEIE